MITMADRGQFGTVQILHVDDDPALGNLVADFLTQNNGSNYNVISETDSIAAQEIINERGDSIDCIISDYDMPEIDGLELLEFVRERYPDLPFILFTGKGSEEIASQAVNAGVTGYLQKGGPDQLERLQNRVIHAAENHRAKVQSERYTTVLKALNYPIYVVDENAEFSYVNDAFVEMTGYSHDEIIGESPSFIKSEDGVQRANDVLRSVVSSSGPDRETFRIEIHTKDGDTVPCRDHMAALPFDQDFRGSVGILRDISKEEQRQKQLKQQNEQFEEIISFVSHDLRTPITQAQLGLELAQEDDSTVELERVESAIDRVGAYIKELETLAETGITVNETGKISVDRLASRAWDVLSRESDQLEANSVTIRGDPERTKSLIENLLRNAVEHTEPGVTVRIGSIESSGESGTNNNTERPSGFYVEDTGDGIPEKTRNKAFDAGFTTAKDGSGLGLSIVSRVTEAHDWDITVTDGADGGARFEITGVEIVNEDDAEQEGSVKQAASGYSEI